MFDLLRRIALLSAGVFTFGGPIGAAYSQKWYVHILRCVAITPREQFGGVGVLTETIGITC